MTAIVTPFQDTLMFHSTLGQTPKEDSMLRNTIFGRILGNPNVHTIIRLVKRMNNSKSVLVVKYFTTAVRNVKLNTRRMDIKLTARVIG